MMLARRDDALSVCYDACAASAISDRLVISKQEFINNLSGCDVFAIVDNEVTKGCIFFEPNGFMHIATLPDIKGRWTHRVFKQAVKYGLENYGKIIALIHKDNEAAKKTSSTGWICKNWSR